MQNCIGLRKFQPVILFHDKPVNDECPLNIESVVKAKKRAVDDMMKTNVNYWQDPGNGYAEPLMFNIKQTIYSHQDHSMDGTHGVKQKRRRGNLPKATTAHLKEWLSEHKKHPYPTEDEKMALARETMLSLQQISNWFINARRRHLPLMLGINPQRNAGNVYSYGSSDNSAEDSTSDNGKRIRGCPRYLRKSDLSKHYRRTRRKY